MPSDDAAALVGEPEEVVGAQAGLDVLEGDVVDLLAVGERVAEVRRASASAAGRMSSSSKVTPSALDEPRGVGLGASRRSRSPACVKARMSLRGRPSRSIALAATISACVESRPPLTPMTTLGWPIASQPLLEPGDLDVVGLVAVEREPLGVVGHEREAVDLAAQADVAGRRLERRTRRSGTRSVARRRSVRRLSSKRALPQPLLAEPVEVDVDDGAPRPSGKRSLSPSRSPHS